MSQIHIFGDITGGGTYLLRARLTRRWAFVFGRYRRGVPVSLAAGDYLYVGSALARRGSTTLARRLLRHATRTGGRPPHVLRSHLLAELQAAGSPGLQPSQTKTLRWHIDYLLDVEVVSLAAIYVLGDGAAVERAIAAHLVADPRVWAPAPGLGASDDWGCSASRAMPCGGRSCWRGWRNCTQLPPARCELIHRLHRFSQIEERSRKGSHPQITQIRNALFNL